MEHRRPKKRLIVDFLDIDDAEEKVYKFMILLPNGTSTRLTLRAPEDGMYLEEFIDAVKDEYFKTVKQTDSVTPKRKIMWRSKEIYLEDMFENKIRERISFKQFKPYVCHFLQLHNMWDLTPDTDLLLELPEEYTFETALADLIDNSLQAVWSNGLNERRLVSVEFYEHGILIFDTGPGMDGSDENSIVKWGKMGASVHRSCRGQAIGGKPPYLTRSSFVRHLASVRSEAAATFAVTFTTYITVQTYSFISASTTSATSATAAIEAFLWYVWLRRTYSIHAFREFLPLPFLLSCYRHALVSSKTKESKKVYTLHLEREALLSSSGSEQTWRTDGGIRDPSEDEIKISPKGSFTKVSSAL
ncbi:hypothetical protein HHK36_029172 [Tetracentron sinense]|uniref:Uncharacterized protein n=1 Tax=Tetracentron sinense TaxID=13715 RepID=A0A834YIP8_TETSI|nr:hypothetical protein HHK36_029172 [Tetracentron sinense]